MDLAGARDHAKGTDVNDLENQLTAMLHERAEHFAAMDRLNEILASPSASSSSSTPHDLAELALTSSREIRTRRRLGPTLLGVAACLAVVVVGLAYIVGRDTDTVQTPVDTIRVDPTVARPGDWIFVIGEGHKYAWEGFLDRVDGDDVERLWVLYPTSSTALEPEPPVNLLEQPDPGLRVGSVTEPANNFRLPGNLAPGTYRFCRGSVVAGAELCAPLVVRSP
jgi:hypothetical protein